MSVLSKVLLPLDGSELSKAVLPVAADVVGGGEVIALTVIDQGVREDLGAVADDEHITIEETVDAYHGQVAEQLGRDVRSIKVVGSRPAAEILAAARQQGATAIVMATRGGGGVERLLLGSVTDKVIRASSIPVLVVPTS